MSGKEWRKPDNSDASREIIDNKIVRHCGVTRLASGKRTPFQKFLDEAPDLASTNDDKFQKIAKKLFFIPRIRSELSCGFFSKNDDVILDAWNDSCRRYFESIFAKKLIDYSLTEANRSLLVPLIDNMQTFLLREHSKDQPGFVDLWQRAQSSHCIQNDESIDFYSAQRPDIALLIQEGHFGSSGTVVLNLYDLHYLVHRVPKPDAYGEYFPKGLFEIYRRFKPKRKPEKEGVAEEADDYSSMTTALPVTTGNIPRSAAINDPTYTSFAGTKHPLYRVANRGRIASPLGFCKDNPGLQMGILRSIDPAPVDMRKTKTLTGVTRCPDRLYVAHPAVTRQNPANWHQYCFARGLNSGYVLGLSGSTLLETRAMLFFATAIRDGYFNPNSEKIRSTGDYDHDIIRKYLLFVIGLFVYVEGGHTLSEILTVFDIPEVKMGVHDLTKGTLSLSKQTLIFDHPDIMQLLREALIETIQYRDVLRGKQEVHAALNALHP